MDQSNLSIERWLILLRKAKQSIIKQMPCHVVLSGYDSGIVTLIRGKDKKLRELARNRGFRSEL